MKNLKEIDVIQYKNEVAKNRKDLVIVDEKAQIKINNSINHTFSVINDSMKEFITGYMLSEGMIKSINDIIALKIDGTEIEAEINLNKDYNKSYLKPLESNLTVTKEEILEKMEELRENAIRWEATGGAHVAGIVCENQFIVKEDVSRHVAVDKVIGAGAYEGFNFSKSYIIFSGRMPEDMVMKLARAGIPILISNAAPTYSGIKTAEEENITLVGFVRDNRFNIYTNTNRIKLD